MNGMHVRAENVSKRYRVLTQQRSTLRVLKALARGRRLTRELGALRGVSFAIGRGEKVALIGRNGSGKTTLLRLLAGIIEPSGGRLEVATPPLALFKFWIGHNADLPVLDNIYLFGAICGMTRDALRPQIPEILGQADIRDLGYAPLQDLSPGQQQRLALSIVFRARTDFLIFDETFVHVDHLFFRDCAGFFERLAGSPRTMILTSHDHGFLKKYCQRAIWLERGEIRLDGPVDAVLAAYDGQA